MVADRFALGACDSQAHTLFLEAVETVLGII